MRRLLGSFALAASLAIACIVGSNPASAQSVCNLTSGTSSACVQNLTPFPIIGIEASSGSMFDPGHWITTFIPPGQTKIVTFPVYTRGCVMNVFIKTPATTHMYPGVNVCRITRFVASRW